MLTKFNEVMGASMTAAERNVTGWGGFSPG